MPRPGYTSSAPASKCCGTCKHRETLGGDLWCNYPGTYPFDVFISPQGGCDLYQHGTPERWQRKES
jgi:hypothetical protein